MLILSTGLCKDICFAYSAHRTRIMSWWFGQLVQGLAFCFDLYRLTFPEFLFWDKFSPQIWEMYCWKQRLCNEDWFFLYKYLKIYTHMCMYMCIDTHVYMSACVHMWRLSCYHPCVDHSRYIMLPARNREATIWLSNRVWLMNNKLYIFPKILL